MTHERFRLDEQLGGKCPSCGQKGMYQGRCRENRFVVEGCTRCGFANSYIEERIIDDWGASGLHLVYFTHQHVWLYLEELGLGSREVLHERFRGASLSSGGNLFAYGRLIIQSHQRLRMAVLGPLVERRETDPKQHRLIPDLSDHALQIMDAWI